ncbi:hypothetical protein EIP86_001825 [Pleurotus ostreatoroseus]|nr:hypothetical protein EIP86_001825 [Pleurotus ostreatoroseus]
MNGLHDNAHKRTSITELLNPVGSSSPTASLDGSYGSPQLNTLSSASYVPAQQQQQQHVSPPSSYPMNSSGSSFSLRAASWDRTSTDAAMSAQRRQQEPEASTSACRYGSSTPHSNSHPSSHQPNSHSVYPEQYQRPRPVDEPANYGIDVSWSPSSHEHAQPLAYGAQLVTPVPQMVYAQDRSASDLVRALLFSS